MARDPLFILRAIRRHEVEQVRVVLRACLAVEAGIVDGIRGLEQEVRRNREAARAIQEAHQFLELFALRQSGVRAQRQSAEAALTAAKDRTAEARDAVAAARTAAEGVEELIVRRAAADQIAVNNKMQHSLDDIARTRFRLGRADAI